MREYGNVDNHISINACFDVLHQFIENDPDFFSDLFQLVLDEKTNHARCKNNWNRDPFTYIESDQTKQYCYDLLALMCDKLIDQPNLLSTYNLLIEREVNHAVIAPDDYASADSYANNW